MSRPSYNNQATINILNTLSQCSYPPNFRDFISNIIVELSSAKGAQFFKVNKSVNNATHTIIVVKYMVQTTFNQKAYEIPILIYIGKSFPYEAPEIYLERNPDTGVNPKNLDIDPNTFKITTASMKNWNQFTTVPNVINEITSSFTKFFPIYKLSIKQAPIQNDQSQLSGVSQNIDFSQQQTGYNQYQAPNTNPYGGNVNRGSIYNDPNVNRGSIYNNPPQTIYNTQPQKQETPEEGIKKLLIDEILNNSESRIIEEVKKVKQQEEKLTNYMNEFNSQIDKYMNVINNSNKIQSDYQNLMNNCDIEINSIKNYISENSSKEINSKNFENFIQIANQKLLKIVGIESSIEDFMAIIRKAYEREILSFEETTKIIRNISREVMKIKYYRELLTKKI